MTLAFTTEGVTIDSLDEIIERVSQAYKDIYGQDIDVAQDSPDGQRIGIEAKARADMQAFALDLYNSMDPDLARSVSLDRILKICGITRRPATRSTWDIDVTTDRSLTLSADYTIIDDLGQSWFVPQDVDLTAGTTSVTFRALDFGAISNTSGAALDQATVVLGVTNLVATVDPVIGANEETDAELRRRRNRSLQNPSYTTTGGMFARLANTAGVLDVQVYENDTDSTDARGIPAHSLWVVIEGGTLEDIAETMALNKTGGTGLLGSVTQVYNEERIRPNGTAFNVPHTMKFDRPVTTDLYVNVTATRKVSGDPVDTVIIAQRLAGVDYAIGEEAVASELYEIAYGDEQDPNFFLTALEISDDDITFTDEQLTSALDGKFIIQVANVTVTEVTP